MQKIIAALVALAIGAFAFHAQAQTSNVTLRVGTFGGLAGDLEQIYIGDRLTRQTGVKVEFTRGNPSDIVAKMLAAKGREAPFDVVLLDDQWQNIAIKAGLLAKPDPKQVTNLAHLYPQMLNKDGYGPSFLVYTVGLVFNTDKLKEAGIATPTSWEDFWNPKLAGHIAVPDVTLPQGADFLIKINQMAGGTEKDLKPGLDKIAQLKAGSYYTASNTLEQQLASGDVWMSVWTSGRAWNMIDRGKPIGYVVPKEGSVAGLDTIDLVAGSPRAKEAQMFINMQLDPITQVSWAIEFGYGPTNNTLTSMFQAYPDLAKKMPSSPADFAQLYVANMDLYNGSQKQTLDYWNRTVKH